jgi:hypothetical protein
MLTRWADGNISVEATTQSGNIFPEATRTVRLVPPAPARLARGPRRAPLRCSAMLSCVAAWLVEQL